MTFSQWNRPRKPHSQEWLGDTGKNQIYHRGWMKNQGFEHDMFDGRPAIGVFSTWSVLVERLPEWRPRKDVPISRYAYPLHTQVVGTNTGADLDFLKGKHSAPVRRESHE